MAVDVSNRTNQIRHAVYGKDVRENIAGGIEDIAAEVNKFEGNMDNEFGDYKNELNQKLVNYENEINGDFDNYRKEINQKQLDFEDHMNQRQDDYEVEMNQKQLNYEEKINGEFNDYKEEMNQNQAAFEGHMNQKQDDFEVEMNQNQAAFESKVNGEWSDYKKIMDADESIRKNNEQTRQSNEQTRKNNENTRKDNENIRQDNEVLRQQNEIIRQDNEADRKSNEIARETAFAGMQHVDANLELSTARGTFNNLNDRLNNSEGETLANKELVTIKHDLNCYPNVRCICGYYGAGMGLMGDGPAGGTESYLINTRICYPDTSNIKIYVPAHYSIKSPVIQELDTNKYLIASENSTETKSILINLMEVA